MTRTSASGEAAKTSREMATSARTGIGLAGKGGDGKNLALDIRRERRRTTVGGRISSTT